MRIGMRESVHGIVAASKICDRHEEFILPKLGSRVKKASVPIWRIKSWVMVVQMYFCSRAGQAAVR